LRDQTDLPSRRALLQANFELAALARKDRLAHCQTNMVDALRRSGRLDEALAGCERAGDR
jgi:hypothetical protein